MLPAIFTDCIRVMTSYYKGVLIDNKCLEFLNSYYSPNILVKYDMK